MVKLGRPRVHYKYPIYKDIVCPTTSSVKFLLVVCALGPLKWQFGIYLLI